MLVDNIELTVKAGKGGDGAATFFRDGRTAKGGPDGGNGGNGGNIYFRGSNNVTDLRQFRYQKKIIADDGIPGKHKKLFGKNAEHITILLPIGTTITDINTGEKIDITDTTTPILMAQGGAGGRGNDEFKSATNQTPRFAEKGGEGQETRLLLELRLIADVGLIGLPNSGKSSLLNVLTRARPKIGDYPFTTLEPNIGMMGNLAIADIPGLIEGAAEGKGLGISFLKHIEKTKIVVHCIDLTAGDPEANYETVRREFKKYSEKLLEKTELILLTKTDLVEEKTAERAAAVFKKKGKQVFSCSIFQPEKISELKRILNVKLDKKTS